MTRAVRLLGMMIRPPTAAVIFLFGAIGVADAGRGAALHPLFTVVPLILAAWFIHGTVLNDLGDEAIDRVNLSNARGRPLVSGDSTRKELLALGTAAAGIALATAYAVNWRVGVVVSVGVLLNMAYSIRPLRLCDRGVVAPLLLPAGYVALPYLVGVFACQADLTRRDLLLLVGLYVAFIGRIALKDFRDVTGDRMFGKRTFLLRYGRQATCVFSAVCWVAGTMTLLLLFPPWSALIVASTVLLVCALYGLRLLADDNSAISEQVVIGAIAQAGRGLAVLVLAQLTMVDKGWSDGAMTIVLVAVAGTFTSLYAVALADRQRVLELRPF